LIPQLNDLRKPGETALLIFDGHSSHESEEADQVAEENNIQFIRLPSHTTHKLQPLDVGVFGPMQAAWRKQSKEYTLRTSAEMPLAQVVKEYLEARIRVMKEGNITSAWKKSGLRGLNPKTFGTSDYGPSQLTSTNTRLPPSYPQTTSTSIDLDLESDTASDSSGSAPWSPTSSANEEPGSDSTDAGGQTPSPHPHNKLVEPTVVPSPFSDDDDDPVEPPDGSSCFPRSYDGPSRFPHSYDRSLRFSGSYDGPSHFLGSYDDPAQPTKSHQTPVAEGTNQSADHSSHFSTPPSPQSNKSHQLSRRQSGLTLQKIPGLPLTPRRTRSHGFLTPLPPEPPKKDRRLNDQRLIEQKYRDVLNENERLQERNEILHSNNAKVENLLQAAYTDLVFARQHIATLQVENTAKKKDKQKHNNTKAEWLTSEANRKQRAEEKAAREKKEAEEKVVKDRKETEARERQGVRNERAVSGKFTGLLAGKSKDDLKDIAQALCLGPGGTNQQLADRINHYLDDHPDLENDERFKGLFAARTKKKKKRKQPTLAATDGGQDGGDDTTVPPSQRPRLL
jgi:hypothetical protein